MPTSLPSPVIVVPGITATYLRDDYTLPPEQIWTVLSKDYGRATLHPDNLAYECLGPARVASGQIYEVAYKELIEELRYNLTLNITQPVPVYPFGYDWRMPLDQTEAALAAFIDEVIERTKLMRHYDVDGYAAAPKVSLVGHSMGGLIIAGCLQRLGKNARVDKVATLASPFRGSFEAAIKITTGTADMGNPQRSRERDMARLTPALYHLLPDVPGGLTVKDPSFGKTLFEPGVWQPSIVDTIAEFIKNFGLNRQDRDKQAANLFSGILKQAKAHRDRIESFKITDARLESKDWLCVVGVDCETRVHLNIESKHGQPEFDLSSNFRMNHWQTGQTPEEKRLTGDGTVPLDGAIPAFLSPENLVCVTPDDFSYWEVQDKLMAKAAGFHGILPNMNMLHRMLVRHLSGRPAKHDNTWGYPIPGVSRDNWDSPLKGLDP